MMGYLIDQNDKGVSVVIEYILSLVITSMLFTILILSSSNTLRTTNQVVTNEQLGIIAGDIANSISIFSSNIYNNQYMDNYYYNSELSYTTMIDLPPTAQGDQYVAQIYYFPVNNSGFVKVIYGLNYNINRTASFYSNVSIANYTLYYNGNNVKIYYPDIDGKINISVS